MRLRGGLSGCWQVAAVPMRAPVVVLAAISAAVARVHGSDCEPELRACEKDAHCRHGILSTVGGHMGAVPTGLAPLDHLVDCAAVAVGAAPSREHAAAAKRALKSLPKKPLVVGKKDWDAPPENFTFGLPCVHHEEGLGENRKLLAFGHDKKPVKVHQRRNYFGHCWHPNCFRGSFDNFSSPEESEALYHYFRPMLDKDAERNGRGSEGHGASGYIGYPLKKTMKREHPAVVGVVRRMARYMKEHFGVVGAIPASTNIRSTDHTAANEIAGIVTESQFEMKFRKGEVYKSSEGGWHWDNAVKNDWLYTCLLYIGTSNVTGGATIFIDRQDEHGRIVQGAAVLHYRNRLLCFSSGAENVHTGAKNYAGYRSLFQVWFKCEVEDEEHGHPEESPGTRRVIEFLEKQSHALGWVEDANLNGKRDTFRQQELSDDRELMRKREEWERDKRQHLRERHQEL